MKAEGKVWINKIWSRGKLSAATNMSIGLIEGFHTNRHVAALLTRHRSIYEEPLEIPFVGSTKHRDAIDSAFLFEVIASVGDCKSLKPTLL